MIFVKKIVKNIWKQNQKLFESKIKNNIWNENLKKIFESKIKNIICINTTCSSPSPLCLDWKYETRAVNLSIICANLILNIYYIFFLDFRCFARRNVISNDNIPFNQEKNSWNAKKCKEPPTQAGPQSIWGFLLGCNQT